MASSFSKSYKDCIPKDRTAGAYGAALIGNIIRWMEKQDCMLQQDEAAWNASLRVHLGGRPKPKVRGRKG